MYQTKTGKIILCFFFQLIILLLLASSSFHVIPTERNGHVDRNFLAITDITIAPLFLVICLSLVLVLTKGFLYDSM